MTERNARPRPPKFDPPKRPKPLIGPMIMIAGVAALFVWRKVWPDDPRIPYVMAACAIIGLPVLAWGLWRVRRRG